MGKIVNTISEINSRSELLTYLLTYLRTLPLKITSLMTNDCWGGEVDYLLW